MRRGVRAPHVTSAIMSRPSLLLAFLATLTFGAPVAAQSRDSLPVRTNQWPVKTREFVDLWLHGFALLADDSLPVPLFRRGYAEAITVEKNRRGIVTDLDANADSLRAQLRKNASLAGAQFAALAFESEAEMDRGFEAFFSTNGEPRKATNGQAAQMISYLAGYFPNADDRAWARRFTNSLQSERTKFHHAWWVEEQRRRVQALATVDSLWQGVLRPSLSRFLAGTKQVGGSLVLALPLEGEGRTMPFGQRQNVIAVPLPDSVGAAADALYVLAHELVGTVATSVVEDNLSPAQKRAGEGERLTAIALVRGGLMLLQRAAPQMAEGYARFYLRVARVTYTDNPLDALERAFPLHADLAGTLRRQIDLSFGGI